MSRVRVIGLTGGIGSGKSTVATMLRELGAPVVDADLLAREVVAPGSPGLAAVVAAYGPGVLAADGSLDRKKLAAIVFTDDERRRQLEAITHPRIAEAAQRAIADHAVAGHVVVFYEAALLVENKAHERLDGLVVVSAPRQVQIERVMARDGISEEDAKARIRAQLPLSEKLAVATHVIDNAGSPAHTRAQVERLWKELQA